MSARDAAALRQAARARKVEELIASIEAGELHDDHVWDLYYACKARIDGP